MRYEHYRDAKEYFKIGINQSRGHFHRAIELIYCLNGPKPVSVEGEEFDLEEGELLFVPPFSNHVYPRDGEHNSLCVVMPVEYTDIYEKETNGKSFKSLVFKDKDFCRDIYETLMKLKDSNNLLVLKGIYSYVLGRLIEKSTLEEREQNYGDMFAIRVLTYLEKHYTEELSLEMVASALGYSRCYFSALFKKVFHRGFCEYLSMLRVQKSLPLLASIPINEAAFAVGFGSVQNYYTNFKRIMGMTPRVYISSKE